MENHDYVIDSFCRSANDALSCLLTEFDVHELILKCRTLKNKCSQEFTCFVGKNHSNINANFSNIKSQLNLSSLSWSLPLREVSIEQDKLVLRLSRQHAFRSVLIEILNSGGNYGLRPSLPLTAVLLTQDLQADDLTLTEHRIYLLESATAKLLRNCGYQVSGENEGDVCLQYSTKSNEKRNCVWNLQCGSVSNLEGEVVTLKEYTRLRERDMRVMSEHRQWEISQDEVIKKLTAAAVTVDLLTHKTSNNITLDCSDEIMECRQKSSRGAVFILYNAARLRALLQKYQEKKEEGVYPEVPCPEEVDFKLLTGEDEWQILFNFLLQYPKVLREIAESASVGQVPIFQLCDFVSKMCQAFSVYYKHVRVLQDSKPHLYPLLAARISFVKAVDKVLQHALTMLSIDTIDRM